MSSGRACLLALMLAGGLAAPVHAELSQKQLDDARDAIEQYAKEMTTFLPCAPMFFFDARAGAAKFTEDTYGDSAVHKVIDEYIDKENGSRADERELALAWFMYAKPQYVQDIRTLTAFCLEHDYAKQTYEYRGVSIPLSMRPPFNGK